MRDAHGRFGPVDVLAAGAAGSVHVDTQVGRVDLDVEVVVDFRRHEYGRKRRMATVTGVERRLADEPVHAEFGPEPAERVIALDVHGRALDAGDLALRHLDQLGIESVGLGPFQVHAQQHLGPILRFGPARTGLDVEECIRVVGLAAEHALEFEFLDVDLDTGHVGLHLHER